MAKKKPQLVDATGRPYTKQARTLVLYWETPFENPRKQLVADLPIGEVRQEDLRNIDQIKEKFDIIAAVACLQCMEPSKVPTTVEKLASMLNLKGELYITTPSFEWAAEQINNPEPHPLIHMVMCGTEKIPHRSVFTLLWLRQIIQQAHLVPRYATPELYQLTVNGQPMEMVRNYVIGWKYDDHTPSTAVDDPDSSGGLPELAIE